METEKRTILFHNRETKYNGFVHSYSNSMLPEIGSPRHDSTIPRIPIKKKYVDFWSKAMR